MPNLYCCGGDVTKDNGYGTYVPADREDPMGPENFILKHTVPGNLFHLDLNKLVDLTMMTIEVSSGIMCT